MAKPPPQEDIDPLGGQPTPHASYVTGGQQPMQPMEDDRQALRHPRYRLGRD